MSDAMDEIAYWIHTKRAPCLMNYDNPLKKCDREPCGVAEETPSPKKKKKRKLSLLDDDSDSTEHRQNVFFESSHKRPPPKIKRESSPGSDVDFNIKNTPVREKRQRAKVQKNNRTLNKKTKVLTSTPKSTVHLRRSLRHNKGVNHFNSSFDIFNSIVSNGAHASNNASPEKLTLKKPERSEPLAGGDRNTENKKNCNLRNRSKQTQNGQYDDESDVSGFTANYIRSTKVQSNKSPKKLRCKPGRNLVKESRQQTREHSSTVACADKGVGTSVPPVLFSTDSSQNLINLVTTEIHHSSNKLDKSTSPLKFMDTTAERKDEGKARRKGKTLDVSFQSQSSRSRYPKRNKTPAAGNVAEATRSADKRRKSEKKCIEFNNSDKKENPEEKPMSKTRSGRSIKLLQRENSVLVVSNSTEPVSSTVSLNVASRNSAAKRRPPARQSRNKPERALAAHSPRRDSRDRSGFAACFSESDDDSEPLVQRKFFCA